MFDRPALTDLPKGRAAYSDRTAWVMACFSMLAYDPFEKGDKELDALKANLARGGFALIRCFDRHGTQAFFATGTDYSVLSFRGTQKNFYDIIADIDIRLRRDSKDSKGEVHCGFARAYQALHDDIREAIMQSAQPVYITGHSLGGALAVMAAKMNPFDNVAAVYTFGCPRVGNWELDREIVAPIYRMVNKSDIVPRLPFVAAGYRHCGDLRYISGDGGITRTASVFNYDIPFLSLLLATVGFIPIKNHRVMDYVNAAGDFAEARHEERARMISAIMGAVGSAAGGAVTAAAFFKRRLKRIRTDTARARRAALKGQTRPRSE